ncbi:MAG: DUF4340 domain-containing protein [Chloroflexi bacterium]|nr:DUF4340 domain-containing protein [Chloroflexota bacterium]
MIRRSTWIALALFAVLAGVAYGANRYKSQKSGAEATPSATPVELVSFSLNDVVGVEIQGPDQTVVLRRSDPEADWQVVQPTPQKNEFANQQRIIAAVYNLIAPSVLTTLSDTSDLKALGLNKPTYIIKVRLKDGQTWQMNVGNQTPIQSGYYVQVGKQIAVVDKYSLSSVLELLQAPPLATPFPTPEATGQANPTSTPAPVPPTPTPTATPPPATPTPQS